MIISTFTLSDPNVSDQVRYHIEVTSQTANGVPVWSSLLASVTSELMAQGTTSYQWPAITSPGYYWWRVWCEDEYGMMSSTETILGQGGIAALSYKTDFDVVEIDPDPGSGWGNHLLFGVIITTTVI